MPAVSIVLPAYNREATIMAAVQSVLRQTFSDFELLVVDDGSADATVARLQEIQDPRLRVIEHKVNQGPSQARNTGVEAAIAPWVAFQDSDDEWLPEKLERQMARLTAPGADFIAAYCGMAVVGGLEAQDRTTLRYVPDPELDGVEGDIVPTMLTASLVSTQTLVARRDALQEIGGFDTTLSFLEDWDCALRLALKGRFAFVDAPLVMQRFSPNSLTGNAPARTAARIEIIRKHHALLERHPVQLAQQYRTLAGEHRRAGDFALARNAIREARKLTPADPQLWALEIFLILQQIRKPAS